MAVSIPRCCSLIQSRELDAMDRDCEANLIRGENPQVSAINAAERDREGRRCSNSDQIVNIAIRTCLPLRRRLVFVHTSARSVRNASRRFSTTCVRTAGVVLCPGPFVRVLKDGQGSA